MNTNQLKKFAQAARTKLIEQVGAKLNYVLTHDTAELRGKANTLKKLNEAISPVLRSTKDTLQNKAANQLRRFL